MYDIYNTKFNIVVKLLGMWCKSTQFHPCCKEDKRKLYTTGLCWEGAFGGRI